MGLLHQMLALFLLVVFIDVTMSCSCISTHPQEKFCYADFVMQVTLKKEGKPIYKKYKTTVTRNGVTKEKFFKESRAEEIQFYATIHRIFKLTNATEGLLTPDTRRVHLYTPGSESLCGVELNVNTKYLISGTVYDGKLTLDICTSWLSPWAWVSKIQRKNLQSRYADNCECQIVTVPFLNDKSANSASCLFKSFGMYKDCYERESACILDKNSSTGECKWHNNKHMKKCRASKHAPMEP